MRGLFVFVVFGLHHSPRFSSNNQEANEMSSEIKTIAIVLATLAVIYRVDGARRLLTNGF